jgi:hypothetical protein
MLVNILNLNLRVTERLNNQYICKPFNKYVNKYTV